MSSASRVPFGATLRDAAKFYAAHLKAVTGSRKIREVVADLLVARSADGMSAAIQFYFQLIIARMALREIRAGQFEAS